MLLRLWHVLSEEHLLLPDWIWKLRSATVAIVLIFVSRWKGGSPFRGLKQEASFRLQPSLLRNASTAEMHPFWLSFESPELEKEFRDHDSRSANALCVDLYQVFSLIEAIIQLISIAANQPHWAAHMFTLSMTAVCLALARRRRLHGVLHLMLILVYHTVTFGSATKNQQPLTAACGLAIELILYTFTLRRWYIGMCNRVTISSIQFLVASVGFVMDSADFSPSPCQSMAFSSALHSPDRIQQCVMDIIHKATSVNCYSHIIRCAVDSFAVHAICASLLYANDLYLRREFALLRRLSQSDHELKHIMSSLTYGIVVLTDTKAVYVNKAAEDLLHLDQDFQERAVTRDDCLDWFCSMYGNQKTRIMKSLKGLLEGCTSDVARFEDVSVTVAADTHPRLGRPVIDVQRIREGIASMKQEGYIPTFDQAVSNTLTVSMSACACTWFGQKAVFVAISDMTYRMVAEEAKAKFFAACSHELRTPLNGIMGMLQLLRDQERMSPQGARYLEIALHSSDMLLHLVNEILEMSVLKRSKTRKHIVHLTEADPRAVALPVLDLFAILSQQNQLCVTLACHRNLPQRVLMDEQRVHQILLHLLSNAFKFTEKEGTISVTVRTHKVILNTKSTGEQTSLSRSESVESSPGEESEHCGSSSRRMRSSDSLCFSTTAADAGSLSPLSARLSGITLPVNVSQQGLNSDASVAFELFPLTRRYWDLSMKRLIRRRRDAGPISMGGLLQASQQSAATHEDSFELCAGHLREHQDLYRFLVSAPEDQLRDMTVGIELQFDVCDDGIGINAQDSSAMFTAFGKSLDPDKYANSQGSGLGLAICRELCELSGGTIGIDTSEKMISGGTRVYFTSTCQLPGGESMKYLLQVLQEAADEFRHHYGSVMEVDGSPVDLIALQTKLLGSPSTAVRQSVHGSESSFTVGPDRSLDTSGSSWTTSREHSPLAWSLKPSPTPNSPCAAGPAITKPFPTSAPGRSPCQSPTPRLVLSRSLNGSTGATPTSLVAASPAWRHGVPGTPLMSPQLKGLTCAPLLRLVTSSSLSSPAVSVHQTPTKKPREERALKPVSEVLGESTYSLAAALQTVSEAERPPESPQLEAPRSTVRIPRRRRCASSPQAGDPLNDFLSSVSEHVKSSSRDSSSDDRQDFEPAQELDAQITQDAVCDNEDMKYADGSPFHSTARDHVNPFSPSDTSDSELGCMPHPCFSHNELEVPPTAKLLTSRNSPIDSSLHKNVRTRILLVDDNPFNLEVARSMLTTWPEYQVSVETAKTGCEALDKFKDAILMSVPFELVIMDCQMPIMDGFEATAAIRAVEKSYDRSPTPIMGLTAFCEEKDKCMAIGMDDFITKPVSSAVLRSRVKMWIERRKESFLVA